MRAIPASQPAERRRRDERLAAHKVKVEVEVRIAVEECQGGGQVASGLAAITLAACQLAAVWARQRGDQLIPVPVEGSGAEAAEAAAALEAAAAAGRLRLRGHAQRGRGLQQADASLAGCAACPGRLVGRHRRLGRQRSNRRRRGWQGRGLDATGSAAATCCRPGPLCAAGRAAGAAAQPCAAWAELASLLWRIPAAHGK